MGNIGKEQATFEVLATPEIDASEAETNPASADAAAEQWSAWFAHLRSLETTTGPRP